MSLKVAVCDDSQEDRKYIADMLDNWSYGKNVRVTLCSSAENFLFEYDDAHGFDIILLDVGMPGLNGVELAKLLRSRGDCAQIVFITGFADYIAEGYEVSALHYLMKPVREEKLFEVLDRAAENSEKTEQALIVETKSDVMRFKISEIEYVAALGHGTVISASGKITDIGIGISAISKKLGDGFIKCHRSYIVGLRHISSITKDEIVLDNGVKVPLARGSRREVIGAFIKFYRGEKDGLC